MVIVSDDGIVVDWTLVPFTLHWIEILLLFVFKISAENFNVFPRYSAMFNECTIVKAGVAEKLVLLHFIPFTPLVGWFWEISASPKYEVIVNPVKLLDTSPQDQILCGSRLSLSFTEWLLKGYQHKR